MSDSSEGSNEKDKDYFRKYGFDMYPSRRSKETNSFWYKLSFDNRYKSHCSKVCEKNVLSAINDSEWFFFIFNMPAFYLIIISSLIKKKP